MTVEQNTSVRGAMKNLKPAFLGDGFKPQVALSQVTIKGGRRAIPTKLFQEKIGKIMLGQVVG
jgi:hypothetical protein